MDTTRMQAAADRLGSKLDGLDLDADERAVLEAICAAGADSVESVPSDVEGFAFDPSPPGGKPDAGPGGTSDITLGLRKSAGGNASGVMFLTFTFKMA
jgi:hypothetical protein